MISGTRALRGVEHGCRSTSLNPKGTTMKVSFRLSDDDRERYGGDEWVSLDTDGLADLGYDRLNALEKDIRREEDTSIPRILAIEWPRTTMLGYRALSWIARQAAGLDKPDWKGYKPDIINATFRIDRGGDGGDPPVDGSSEQPSEKTSPAKNARSKRG